MSALDSIIKWAEEDLLDWQRDSVRRLLTQEELTSEDKEEILRMEQKKTMVLKTLSILRQSRNL